MALHKKPRVYYISSANRLNPGVTTSSEFSVELPAEKINFIPKTAKISSIIIPNSFYPITAFSGDFEVDGNSLTVPPGPYTPDTLAAELQTQTQTILPAATVTYDSDTGKFTWTNGANFTLDFDVANSIGPSIGFGLTTNAGNTTYTSPGVVNLTGGNYIFVKSSLITGVDAGTLLIDGGTTVDNILMAVPILTDYGFIPTYEPINTENYIFNIENSVLSETIRLRGKAVSPYTIDFSITDEKGNLIDLNGLDWSFVLELSPHIYDGKQVSNT